MYKNQFQEDYFKARGSRINQSKRDIQYCLEINRVNAFFKNGILLDYGAGMGEFSQLFKSPESRVYVYDISDYAKSHLSKIGLSVIDDFGSIERNFFDCAILRGVLQHLEDPYNELIEIGAKIKLGGYLILLSTPNTRSLSFFLTGKHPAINPKKSYLYPVDINIISYLERNGFKLKKKYYPYWNSPYRNILMDFLNLFLCAFGIKKEFPFFRNIMELYFEKTA